MRDQFRLKISARNVPAGLSPILPSSLDSDAVAIVRRLNRHGHRAYLVGGCVRDLLLGREPKDFDVATSARPRQIKKVCRNSRIIGRRFRLVHVHCTGGKIIEVSTFRKDPRAEDSDSDSDSTEAEDDEDLLLVRDNVFGSEEEDAVRRDFTINGLFYEVETEAVFDYVGGVEDLGKRVLRTIGDPTRRLREDPVRILRAIKFAARLDFTFNAELAAAMAECHDDLVRSAPPRVFEEVVRMLGGPHPERAFTILAHFGIMEVLLPELGIRQHREDNLRLTRLVGRLQQLGALDRGRRSFPTALYFVVLLYDEAMRRISEAEAEDYSAVEALDSLIKPFALRCRLSRRDTARMRAMILALRRIDPSFPGPRNRRRRRVPMREFVSREYFADALLLFRVICGAENRSFEDLRVWEERRAEMGGDPTFDPESDQDPAAAPEARPTRRRRRRRSRSRSRDPS